MSSEKPEAQILGVTGIQSEEKVHDFGRSTPPAQNLSPNGVNSEEKVHSQRVPLSSDKEYRKTLLNLTNLENNLRNRQTGNIKRKANLLKRVNGLRRKLQMKEMTLKDFILE